MSLEDQQKTIALAEKMKGSKLTRREQYILCIACDYAEKEGVIIQSREVISVFLAIVRYFSTAEEISKEENPRS